MTEAAHLSDATDDFFSGGTGLSVRSTYLRMSQCAERQTSLRVRVYPSATRLALARDCLRLAKGVLADSPTLAVAHYALAVSFFQLGAGDAFQQALGHAWRTAPNEGWLAARRVDLALSAPAGLSKKNKAHLASDISVLLTAPSNVIFVAKRYLRSAEEGDLILRVIELQDPDKQRRFVDAVRLLARAQGPKT
jgi:hypothetical protein